MTKKLTLPLLFLGSFASLMGQQHQRPNVIFILADDLGYGDLGCYGQQIIQTPHIDALAQQGMRFTDFYAGCSVSAPSRASLMTGRHTGHTKVRGNKEIQPEGQSPMADLPTLGTLFQRAGYTTGIFGKWGLGFPGSGSEPLDRGFDRFYGYNCQRQSHLYYPEHLWADREQVTLPENERNGRGTYAPDLIQQDAIAFIKQAADAQKPFFAMMTYTLPHAELNLPHDALYESYRSKVEPRPWNSQYKGDYPSTPDAHASFAAMVGRLDMYVGQLMQTLKELGIEERTLVVFTSDNGPHREGGANPEYFNSSGSLRGVKRDLYEGGVRVPMIARWSGTIAPGSQTATPGAFWDFLPTFATMLGKPTEARGTDGTSLLGLMTGKGQVSSERPLYWEFHEEGGKMALRQGSWKLVALNVDSGSPTYELYRLDVDRAERNNLASAQPQVVRRLAQTMQRMRTTSADFPFAYEHKSK